MEFASPRGTHQLPHAALHFPFSRGEVSDILPQNFFPALWLHVYWISNSLVWLQGIYRFTQRFTHPPARPPTLPSSARHFSARF
ncbi:hypothetical protein E2C01_091532 [Portunus trituberculatus]|uniref:Uncharacterized protein n=1 Tax=Portunus trituberculatus TaxID=210409 RepID=A0A5B7JE67_PORTR|nr:hypothetical protein [Portunus trituberculatus]